MSITWDDLRKHLDGNSGFERLHQAEAEVRRLQEELMRATSQLEDIRSSVVRRLEGALRAADILDVDAPEELWDRLKSLTSTIGRSPGGYFWRPQRRVPFQAGISRAMWRLSLDSGGSAGDRGVLTSSEFKKLIGRKRLRDLEAGREVHADLPNGLKVTVTRAESERR